MYLLYINIHISVSLFIHAYCIHILVITCYIYMTMKPLWVHVATTAKGNSSNYSKRSYWWSWDKQGEKHPEKYLLSFLFCLLLLKRLQRNPYLPSVTVGPLNRLSTTVKLHTVHKTFLLTIPSVKNPKFATHKVMQMLLYKW